MTTRIGNPDTPADIEVRECLDRTPPRSFVMVAGAGSGKTTSLVKALEHLLITHGPALRRAGRRIACITYTEVAVGEISADVGGNPLIHVSTIHSFLWSLIKSFQADISAWLAHRIEEKIASRREHHDKPGTREATRVKLTAEIEELEAELAVISAVRTFTYETGSDYAEGILGHDDILKLTPYCIQKYPLLRKVVASRFPYIFVDESQDTNPDVVDALRQIAAEQADICVGFFGDPMQKIYPGGTGIVPIEPDWREVKKPENFRCPTTVLRLINAIRAEGDGLQQTGGRTQLVGEQIVPIEGSVNIFVLPADDRRTMRLSEVREWLKQTTEDCLWQSDEPEADVRLLVLVHRMAATRLGFPTLYAALHDKAPSSLKDGLEDGTAWPLRALVRHVLPAVLADRAGDGFTLMSILRAESPRLEPARLQGEDVPNMLQSLSHDMQALGGFLADGSSATIGDVLRFINERKLFRLDDRFQDYLVAEPVDNGRGSFKNVMAFLDCPIAEIWGYRRYIEEESPFATQQGIKGAQFERVLVVLDDEEGNHSHFSYGKYLGYSDLSETDNKNIADHKESVLDRTRRLFYVCCSRALKDLAIVIFAPDADLAKEAVEQRGLFAGASILGLADLNLKADA